MLELLKAAQRVSSSTSESSLPPDILAFLLDYPDVPDLETERARIAELLDGDGFDLQYYSRDDDPNLLILQFRQVAREQSASFLFATAQDLTDALGLRSATPDIDPPWTDIETVPPDTEGVGDVVWALCNSRANAPDKLDWAPRLINAAAVHNGMGITGKGIVIGQPDTGVAEHIEIARGIDSARGFDFLANVAGGRDPLSPDMGSPGHGTGTSSVAVSRTDFVIRGSAPGATLVPLRCLNSVVIGSGTAVARAIDYGRGNGCHIITMSLGGPFSGPALRRAIARAVAADMIVLAAAGNCVGMVTYPARDPAVIAVAAINEHRTPWRGSSRGSAVDISAPGENVSVARRKAFEPGAPADPDATRRVDRRGQGTSYAVALTAGVAALWLEHFTRPRVRAEARRRGVAVQDLFRAALRATANVPAGWNSGQMGAGIVDAQALLALPLASIPLAPATEAPDIPMLAGAPTGLDDRFSAEASFLAFDWNLRESAARAAGLESAMPPVPSPQLAAHLARQSPTGFPTPAAIVTPATPPADLDEALRKLGASTSGGLESTTAVTEAQARDRLRSEGTETVLERAHDMLEHRRSSAPSLVNPDAQAEALGYMRRALDDTLLGGPPTQMTDSARRVTLEALVRLTGRPAVKVPPDRDSLLALKLGEWASFLKPTEDRWRPVTDAVGRIDVKVPDGRWVHAGTGFVAGKGIVVTNRHVLDTFAEPLPMPAGEQAFRQAFEASIIFDTDAVDETTRYRVTGILSAGKDRIGRRVRLGSLDIAVLRIEADNGTAPHPAPIGRFPGDLSDTGLDNILVAGYPARPGEANEPADAGQIGAFWTRIDEIFGDEYSVKYMSPGKVMGRPGTIPGDTGARVFSHDATTLGGNSGSAIAALSGDMGYCGLHFGGSTLTQNLAHDIAALIANGDGVFDTGLLSGNG